MQTMKSTRKLIALLLAFVLTLPLIPTGSAQAAGPPAPAETPVVTEEFDYFKRVYPTLSQTDHVFETVTSHELSTLLDSEGTYLVLIGGAASQATQAQIAEINEQAKAYGVEKIYNFDTRLDGASLDITADNAADLDKKLYVDLVNTYLLNLPEGDSQVSYGSGESAVSAPKITEPFLFAYKKGRTAEDAAAPIIASASSDWGDFFKSIAVGPEGAEVVQHDVFTVEDYYTTVYDDRLGRDIFRVTEDENVRVKDIVFEHITYHELQELLKTEGTHNILIGGSWCPNTQPVIGLVNDAALSKGITKIYNFDTKLDGGSTNNYQIRDSANRHANLYVDLVNDDLPNLTTFNAGQTPPTQISYGPEGDRVSATRLQIPYPFIYNKDAVNAEGDRAPILGHVELMYYWDNIGTDAEPTGQRVRYKQALDLLYSRLELTPSGLTGIAPSHTGVNDGRITGTTAALEYKLASSDTYTRATNEAVTGLAPGTYQVRYAAKTGYNAESTPRPPIYPANPTPPPTELYYSAGPAVEVVVPASGTEPGGEGAFDYFKRVYPSLSQTDHVFETVTSHELSTLLDSDGTYLVLIGGAASQATQAQIAEINEQAKAYGVEKIYNFDTRLDGASLDITADNAADLDKKLYVDLVNTYLLNLPEGGPQVSYGSGESAVSAPKITEPFLFAYEKGRTETESDAAAPIIASASSQWGDFFDSIAEGSEGAKVVKHDKFTAEDYYSTVYDDKLTEPQRHIFRDTNGENKNVVFEHITYHELQELLKTEGTHNILIGGSWCPNTQPVIGTINDVALSKGITKIYNFDTKLDGGVYGNDFQIRITDHRHANLYVDLVNADLPNLTTFNAGQTPPTQISYGPEGDRVSATRLQIPYPFIYNKDAVNAAGNRAPILGHVELMIYWRDIDKDDTAITLYKQALDLLYSRLELTPSGLTGVAPRHTGANDGRITGTTTALEYKLASGNKYTRATNEAVTGLAPGTYQVRYAAKTGYNAGDTAPTELYYSAGPAVEVVVPASTTPPPSNGNFYPPPVTPPAGEEEGTEEPGEETPRPSTSATVEVSIDEETGYAVAAVTTETIEALIAAARLAEAAGEQAVIEFTVAPGQASAVQLTIPRAAFDALVNGTSAAIKLSYGSLGTLDFDAAALRSIRTAPDGDISFIVSRTSLTDEGKEVLGDRPVYDISVFAGETPIERFGGSTIHVSLPYALGTGEDPAAVIVYALTAAGELETLRGRYVAGDRTVKFGTTHFSEFIIGYNPVVFADVPASAWHAQAITFLAARGITNGTDADHYSPGAGVTRGQFIVLLLGSYGIAPEAGATDNFADAGNTYYTDYLAAAKRYGIANGSGDNRFLPNSPITRQELFTLLYRALNTLGELPEAAADAAADSYSDADQIAPYAREAIEALVARGIVSGSDGKLDPRGQTTRAQAAQVLYNLLSQE